MFKKPTGEAAASETLRRTVPGYVEGLSDARTMPVGFFNILSDEGGERCIHDRVPD